MCSLGAEGHPATESDARGPLCGGEPCDAVARGLRAFFDRRLEGLGGERARLRRLPHGDGPLPALARQRRGEVPAPAIGGASGIRMPTIRCFGRSTRTTSGPTATTPAISAIFARTAWSGSPSRCRRTSGSSIRRPTRRRPRRSWTSGGAFRRSTTWPSPDLTVSIRGHAARTRPADTSWTAASRRFRSRRSVRSPITRRFRTRRRSGFSTTCPRFSGCCSRTIVFAPCPTPSGRARRRCRIPIRRSTRSSSRARWCSSAPAAQCHGGPGQSTPQAPVVRFHDISSQCPRPVDTATPARFAFAPCPPRLARNARTYEITLAERHQDPPHELRSRSGVADRVRRRRARPGRLEQVRRARTARDQQDRPVLPQQQRRHARGGRRSLHRSSSSACRRMRRRASCRRSRARTACTSIGRRRPKSARRCWPICESYRSSRRGFAALGGSPGRARFNPTVVVDPTAGTDRAPYGVRILWKRSSTFSSTRSQAYSAST